MKTEVFVINNSLVDTNVSAAKDSNNELKYWLFRIILQWTWGCRYLFEIVILFSLGIYTEVRFLGYMVTIFLFFWGNSILFSIVAVPIVGVPIPPTVYEGSFFSISSPGLVIFWHFHNSHPNRFEVISHCDFVLNSCDD